MKPVRHCWNPAVDKCPKVTYLLSQLEAWLDALGDPLDRVGEGDAPAVAELLASSLGERPTFCRLLGLLHHTLEQNVDREAVRSFKLRGAAAMARTAERLEARLPWLRRGDGFRLLIHLHALVVGVGQLSNESAVVADVVRDPELRGFHVEFVPELREILGLVLAGWASRTREETRR